MNFKDKAETKNLTKMVIVTALLSITGIVKANENESGHLPRHHLAVFAGGGVEKEHGHSEAGSALGVKYDFQFHKMWSIGVAVEKLFGSGTERSLVVAIPVSFHPNENWRLFFGPGYEFHDKKDKALIRVGVAYEWELKNGWSLSPEVMVDFLEGGAKTYLAGLAIGHQF
jgi:hypothetical protein